MSDTFNTQHGAKMFRRDAPTLDAHYKRKAYQKIRTMERVAIHGIHQWADAMGNGHWLNPPFHADMREILIEVKGKSWIEMKEAQVKANVLKRNHEQEEFKARCKAEESQLNDKLDAFLEGDD